MDNKDILKKLDYIDDFLIGISDVVPYNWDKEYNKSSKYLTQIIKNLGDKNE